MTTLFALLIVLFALTSANGDEPFSRRNVVRGVFVPRIPFTTTSVRTESCLLLNGRNVINEPFSFDFEAAETLFACSEKNGPLVTHYPGKLSLRRSEFACEETPLITYNDAETPAELSPFRLPFVCVEEICVFYTSIGNRVMLSAAILPEEAPILSSEPGKRIPFLATQVLFDFDESMVKKFAEGQAHAFVKGVTGSIDLRAMSYLGTTKAACEFPRVSCTCSRR